ncbi:MAG TPA: hypothetical protein PKU97_15405 [Kofleriaceae bacterium]|nr:hypothetical protein [Kofleriaceae bacterium]
MESASPAPRATPAPPAPAPAASPQPAPAARAAEDLALECAAVPFATTLPIAEASGSVVTPIDGAPALLVVADSGHRGDYLIVDPQTGAVRERGALPLGGPGDDLEGLAVRGDRFWALTSSGWLRAWVRRASPTPHFELVLGPVPIGARYRTAADPAAMTCEATRVNCGRNFEGLCLSSRPVAAVASAGEPTPCVGMAVSKAQGRLYCITERGDQLLIDAQRWLQVADEDVLSDCNIDGDTLWLGSNLFELNRVRRVEKWSTPERAVVTELGALGVGSAEAIAVAGEVLFRLSDTQTSPSLVAKFRCGPVGK